MTISAGACAPVGVILAGGTSRRMGGGDKGLQAFGTGTVLDAVIGRIGPQVSALAINANGDPGRFARFGLPVLADDGPDDCGPLAGVLAALDWAAAQGQAYVLTVPCDTPFLPGDLVPQLLLAATAAPVVVAGLTGAGGLHLHPTCALWSVSLRGAVRDALGRGNLRLGDFARDHAAAIAAFPAAIPDPFLNLNTPGDLAQARGWL